MADASHEGRTLTHEEARRFYDRVGRAQDTQAFYEREAVAQLCSHAELARATHVVELGCGTGKLAAELLASSLPASARYTGLDASGVMVRSARQRTEPFGARASIVQTDGAPVLPVETGSADRFVATYVFDLLGAEDIAAMLLEAHRVLAPGGLIGIAGLTPGERGAARWVSALWTRAFRLRPGLTGGCRPLRMRDDLGPPRWELRFETVVSAYGVASEVVVAARR